MYITLEEIKKHLNIDEDFIEDDEYLTYLYSVAEDAVEKHIDCKLYDIEDDDGTLSNGLKHSMLLFIGHLYENREATSSSKGSIVTVPFAFDYLLDLYQKY